MPIIKKIAIALTVFLFLIFLVYYFLFTTPKKFSEGKVIKIENGSSLLSIGKSLEEHGVIKSSEAFVVLGKIAGVEKTIRAGSYIFEKPLSVFGVVVKMAKGNFEIEQEKITIPEGSTLKEIAELAQDFPNFDKQKFLDKTRKKEGYLFPDTYFLFSNATEDDLIKVMEENWSLKIGEFEKENGFQDKIADPIVIMASIIEKEVATPEDRAIVSGILWKRLEKGMLLQVDATLGYVTSKTSAQLTINDLKSKSPYNTYVYKGLPPTPICNPGLEAIKSALYPKESLYYFYLTGKDGKTYFAKTFDEHKKNKEKYLK